jgi:hypothetical protein
MFNFFLQEVYQEKQTYDISPERLKFNTCGLLQGQA